MPFRRGLHAREQSALAAVLPTSFENFIPDQPNRSAGTGENIRPHIKFNKYVLRQKFRPLGKTAYQTIECSSTGEN
jgi:hypothetical protein